MIIIGPRKKVYNLAWNDTEVEINVTNDEVTKDKFFVHAWSIAKLLEYLTALLNRLKQRKNII